MANQAPQTQKGLGLGNVWPWLFFVDEALEALRGMKGKDGKEPEVSEILWKLFLFCFFLAISPLGIVAGAGWLAAHLLGFDPVAGLKLIGVFEITFIVLLAIWIYKKLVRDPWSRVMTQTRLEYDADTSIKPGDLVAKVRSALGQDNRAADKADDAVRKVLGKAHAQSQTPARVLVIRVPNIRITIGRKSKTDQPLTKAPESAVQRPGQKGDGPEDGWGIH